PGTGGLFPVVRREYDMNLYNFGVEKTFFNRLMSMELRVPFRSTLSSNLDLRLGEFAGFNGGQDERGNPTVNITPTPENTLGSKDPESGNLSVIFKPLFYECPRLAVSGGLGLGIPTGRDQRVTVTDFVGTLGQAGTPNVSVERLRDFKIENSIWSLNPF